MAPAVAEAQAVVLSQHTPPAPVPLQPSQPSPSPERSSSHLLSVARLPSLPSPCLLCCSPLCSFLHLSADVGLTGSSLTKAPWDSSVHSLTPPATTRSCPNWKTDTPIVRSCPAAHMLASRGTRQLPPLLCAASHLKPMLSALAFKGNF